MDQRLFIIRLTANLSSPYNGNAEFPIGRCDDAVFPRTIYSGLS